jgi:hypothetical protein
MSTIGKSAISAQKYPDYPNKKGQQLKKLVEVILNSENLLLEINTGYWHAK